MSEKIYKYFSADVLNLVFKKDEFCSVKCSYPKDYNDPFELFLGVDLSVSTELLATYREIVQELPQTPTTCFSKSPIVTPMWAHYANNHSGFVLEFDVDELRESFEGIAIRDVMYKDNPDKKIESHLERFAVTMKPRHAVWLQDAVLVEAYFSKHTAWSYEQECRLVDNGDYVDKSSGMQILHIPTSCVSSIIVGKSASELLIQSSKSLAEKIGLEWYQGIIGKSHAFPFFKNRSDNIFNFDGESIVLADQTCNACSEPVDTDVELCAWCSITENHENIAAMANPLRLLDHVGELENYFKIVAEIRRGGKK
jgi:Protein of unknown function (DUF2971).